MDEVFESLVRSEFPPHLLERVVDTVRLDIGAHEREVLGATLEALRQHDASTDAQVVDRLFEAVRGSGLGVLGADDTLVALKLGQVDELVITAAPDTLTNIDHLVPAAAAPPPTHTGSAAHGLAAVDAAAAALADGPEPAADGVPAHEKVANHLVTLARQTSAAVRFIEDPALLAEVGGVGARLRFRIES